MISLLTLTSIILDGAALFWSLRIKLD